ncbi:hypothetical protein C4K04_1709 [Pseudomonas chlororaphis]|uniref:Uncharacterized protein n=1 Tax=Pseudomonas chlororaphis TaxID=587753 RepID=A0A3G7TJW0_9PSED|nr:hypothetical protein [Pseudomonas chlororaphis]AZE47397.1 hypothetical protein C4K04_1709 [Pseudomonas chlororaphis]
MKWFWFLFFICLVGCDGTKNEGEHKVSDEVASIHIELGSPVDTFLKTSPVDFTADCLEAVNTCWYELKRGGKGQKLLSVNISQPESVVELGEVVGVSIVKKGNITNNIESVDIVFRGLPDNSTHERNRAFVYKIMGDLKTAGWRKYYFPSDPRIAGSELDKFDWKNDVFGQNPLSHPLFDPDREMSLEQWVGVEGSYNWYLYSGGYIAHVTAQRRNSADDPSRTGVYVIEVEFSSLNNFWRTDFEEETRPQWKALFASHLQELLLRRSETEARAKAAGVVIEEGYKPPVMERSK